MIEKKFEWNNLRRNHCPKCNDEITYDTNAELFFCKNVICDFKISSNRFESLMESMNKEALDVPMFRNGDEVEDLQKADWPICGFCGSVHHPMAKCDGFV